MLPPSKKPTVVSMNKRQPFVLNPGTWKLHIKTPKRIFLVKFEKLFQFGGSIFLQSIKLMKTNHNELSKRDSVL